MSAPLTRADILKAALEQSAVDCNCRPEDFLSDHHTFTLSRPDPRARVYLPLPFAFDLVSYGSCVVAQTSEALRGVAEAYLGRYETAHVFETPNTQALDAMLAPYGLKVCFMAEYFLPDPALVPELPCPYETRVLRRPDFDGLYDGPWHNALCEKRRELDVLGVGAYDGDTLVGLAACSADCASMRQIGIDVLPSCRRRGVAAALSARLTSLILSEGHIPFWCAAWSNIPSVRTALAAGFRPAWIELTARDTAFVDEMNGV